MHTVRGGFVAVVFFDMDGTLVDGDTNDISLQFYVDKGLIPLSYLDPLPEMGRKFFLGQVDINEVAIFAAKPLVGLSREKRDALLHECVSTLIAPRFKKGALKAVAYCRRHGDISVIVTSTNDYLVRHVADALGIDHIIASPMELDQNGVLTGRRCGVVPYQVDKVNRIREFLMQNGLDLKGSRAYGDSVNDMPMLLMTEHPVAVDPNETMHTHKDFDKVAVEHWI